VVGAVKNLTLSKKKIVSFSGDCQPQDIVVSVNRLFVADDLIS
jgi:hypothetical protein